MQSSWLAGPDEYESIDPHRRPGLFSEVATPTPPPLQPNSRGPQFKKPTKPDRSFTGNASNRTPRHPVYLTISEIGDHRRFEDVWIVEPDLNLGFDVYDVSGMLQFCVRDTWRLTKVLQKP